ALFVITGGIFVDGDIEAKPKINTLFLVIGAVLASIMGTTGAAMLLIRVLIHTNKARKFKVHTILFFIAIVANCGGLLTPLGDPPLFMLYLRGADFFWFLKLLPEWAFVNGILCILYFFVDSYYWKKEAPEDRTRERINVKKIKIHGKINFIWLAGVILSVALINYNVIPALKYNPYLSFTREISIFLMAVMSLKFTTHLTRIENSFSWHPIEEVTYLFLGIFMTMVPCIIYLEANANTLGVVSPASFYYFTGGLSAFLDNTPSAVAFYSLAQGLVKSNGALIFNTPTVAGIPEILMKAISVSSVFFGAMTYIGNGPNFMVKAIAESNNIKMPHFFAYMFKFSLIILLPLFILTELIFIINNL
ncbi:MAG: sodium:proton antiporter, partial [Ignavibacteria bacterium]|nr:sodium:proton antiporter [Ignavibacteria bacterium]